MVPFNAAPDGRAGDVLFNKLRYLYSGNYSGRSCFLSGRPVRQGQHRFRIYLSLCTLAAFFNTNTNTYTATSNLLYETTFNHRQTYRDNMSDLRTALAVVRRRY